MAYPGLSSSDFRRETEGIKYDAWEGFDILDDYGPYPYNTRLDLPEPHKDLPWTNQELNQSFQTAQDQLYYQPQQEGSASTQAGTSNSVRRRGGKNPSVPPLLRNSGKTGTNEKKKEIDRRYREKVRESKKKMACELDQLAQENSNLHDENKNLMVDKGSINVSLQSTETETKQLKTEIRNLKNSMTSQQIFVDSFLKKLGNVSNNENHQLEIKKLENEIMILRQTNWEDWSTNKLEIELEIENLEHENKVLKVQVDALCEKIHNDSDAADTKASEIAIDSDDLWGGCSTRCEGLD